MGIFAIYGLWSAAIFFGGMAIGFGLGVVWLNWVRRTN